MEEDQKQIDENWRDDVSDSSIPVLKILDGEKKTFVFIGEGEKRTHPDFGTSVVFNLEFEEENMNWYVAEQNYSLLGQIKTLGNLNGLAVTVSRAGAKKSDTRYTIEKAETKKIPVETIKEE